jgi:hypothetical protein
VWTHGTSLAPAKQKRFLIENPPNPGLSAIKKIKAEKGGLLKNKYLNIKGQLFSSIFSIDGTPFVA